ncbi:MAG: hypothetical protein OYI31_00970 [Chloroflexota bacterium]|nr:hypothetical protein [Chloroflexota bacterium]MDE3267020.1 hypothetical protein [Chloroflexota bacterium]
MTTKALQSAQFEVDSVHDAIEFYYEKGWTDGLPVVPPTEEKVWAFLDAAGLEPDAVIGSYETRKRVVTAEKVAINSVMAGCLPEYFPVVLAIMEPILDPRFNLHVPNSTTGGAAIGFIVNGPIRDRLGMNYRGNVLGPGNRANSTIGRAVRLCQINILGSLAGAGTEDPLGRPVFDRATVGQPGKYAGYHIVENEDDYPTLLPVHVERGFSRDQSAVTVFSTGGHVQISAHSEGSAQKIADTVARHLVGSGRLVASGGYCVIVIPAENAGYLVKDGWSKADFRQAVHEGTRRTAESLAAQGWPVRGGGSSDAGERMLAVTGSADDIYVVTAGGPAGGFIHYMLPYGGSVITCEIRS